MRKLTPIACVLALASFPLACGGGTPAPKDESEATQDKGGGGDDSASSPTASAAAPAASSAAPASPADSSASSELNGPPPAATTTASGDIKPTNSDDPWLAGHQMPPKDVMKVMRANNAKVQGCWKAGLKRDPSTSGEVKVRFVITNDGAVRALKDDGSSMTDPDVTKCVGDVIQKLKFPKQKSPGDAWGSFSINFTP
jgi:hypothetical protein